MKIQFSLKQEYTPEWNDNKAKPKKEQVQVQMITLESMDLLTLADALERAGMTGEVDTSAVGSKEARAILEAVGDILPRYCTIENLEGDDGPISIDLIVKYPQFQDLALELLLALAGISQPEEDDVKN
jgi:hypothetical protein